MTKRIVIIGGGPAGYEAALAGAKYGADITLVEDQGLGGAAVIHDCVPSKSFIAATGIATDLRRVDDMGFQRPEVAGKLLELEAVNAAFKRWRRPKQRIFVHRWTALAFV